MTKVRSQHSVFSRYSTGLALLIISVLATSCGKGASGPLPENMADGSILLPEGPEQTDSTSPPLPPASPNTMTIAVKYVALKEKASDPDYPTRDQVVVLLENMSKKAWYQCDIRFMLETYQAPVVGDLGLIYNPSTFEHLSAARSEFDDRKTALFVKTGAWNHSGALGSNNGYSTLPPANAEGWVVEDHVAESTMLNAHETGHLIGGLYHTSGSNLMNPLVASSNTSITVAQCEQTRANMKKYHSAWLR